MADQDHDGSHIKGLVINFIHHFWPSLIKINSFMKEFITPIIKVRGKDFEKSFFTQVEHDSWVKTIPIEKLRSYTTKYYKGLGTSTTKEA